MSTTSKRDKISNLKKILTKKSLGSKGFTGPTCKNEGQCITNSSGKKKKRTHFSNHSIKPELPIYQNQMYYKKENYGPIYFMNIDVKSFNNILAKQI